MFTFEMDALERHELLYFALLAYVYLFIFHPDAVTLDLQILGKPDERPLGILRQSADLHIIEISDQNIFLFLEQKNIFFVSDIRGHCLVIIEMIRIDVGQNGYVRTFFDAPERRKPPGGKFEYDNA